MKNLQSFDEFITEGTWALEKSKINQYIKELKSISLSDPETFALSVI